MSDPPVLVLASGSPRRIELLTSLDVVFDVRPTDIDETPSAGEDPVALVRRLALAKARAGLDRADEADVVVLGADTVVVLDGDVLGKPSDRDSARAMLAALSGRTHQVLTGVAVASRRSPAAETAGGVALAPARSLAAEVAAAEVTFAELSGDDIDRYVETGDPLDKAGGYGIQGEAGRFVARLVGDRDTVVGLPVTTTRRLLAAAGLPV